MRRSLFAFAFAAVAASAQSFNVDIGSTGAAGGAGAPAPVFGAAAKRPGYWNPIGGMSLGPFPLLGADGAPTSVTCSRDDALGGYFGANNGLTTGYFQYLMDDAHNTGIIASGAVTYTVSGLAPGRYTVFSYAWSPLNAAQLSAVTVAGSTSPNPQIVGGALPALNTFAVGVTHAVHVVDVVAGGTLSITCATAAVAGTFNGFQISDHYAVALTQATNGNLTIAGTGGAPGGVYVTLLTPFQGAFPNGPLFGVDMTIPEALNELAFGPPFFGLLDANGQSSYLVPAPLPTGLTLYGVGLELDPAAPVIVATTAPFSYTFL